jgi:hypothetical protein
LFLNRQIFENPLALKKCRLTFSYMSDQPARLEGGIDLLRRLAKSRAHISKNNSNIHAAIFSSFCFSPHSIKKRATNLWLERCGVIFALEIGFLLRL